VRKYNPIFSFSGWYLKDGKEIHFRSLRELSFMVEMEKQNRTWRSAEGMSVTYYLNGIAHKYHPDFIIDDNVVIEIKPKKMTNLKVNKLKADAMSKWCAEHSMFYQVVSPKKLTKTELKQLSESGKIRIEDHLQTKFKRYLTTC